MTTPRSALRSTIAATMHRHVEAAPMTFIADPEVPLLVAELIIRDFQAAGWTPPQWTPPQPKEEQ